VGQSIVADQIARNDVVDNRGNHFLFGDGGEAVAATPDSDSTSTRQTDSEVCFSMPAASSVTGR